MDELKQQCRISKVLTHITRERTAAPIEVSAAGIPKPNAAWVPGQAFLEGNYVPVHKEYTDVDLIAEFGEIPEDLDGQFSSEMAQIHNLTC